LTKIGIKDKISTEENRTIWWYRRLCKESMQSRRSSSVLQRLHS